MRKIVLLMHVSLDGFVGGPNGEMNWIKVNEEIFEIAFERTNEADTALYGRVTFDMMQSYWPTAGDEPNASKHDKEHSAWYNSVEKVVLSRTLQDGAFTNTRFLSEDVVQEITKLKEKPGKDILVIGSPSVVHLLVQNNLLDEFWLMVNPVVLGQGIPLFKNVQERVNLKLGSTKVFSQGVVCLHYTRV